MKTLAVLFLPLFVFSLGMIGIAATEFIADVRASFFKADSFFQFVQIVFGGS